MKDYDSPSKTAGPPVVILAIVGISLIIFFAFTLPFLKKRSVATAAGDTPHSTISSEATHGGPGSISAGDPSVASLDPAAGGPHASSQALVLDLAEKLRAGNIEGAIGVIGKSNLDPDKVRRFRTLITEGSYKISRGAPFEEIGRLDAAVRYALNFQRLATDLMPADEKRILIDIDRKEGSRELQVTNLHIPTFSVYTSVSTPEANPATAPASETPVSRPVVIAGDAEGPVDPLMLAHEFVEAILNQDFAKAKSLVDSDTVTEEKLAALLIVAEEHGFQRQEKTPLVATATRGDSAWVIAQLASPKTSADFGLEIVKADDASGHWKIAALNLDKFLQASARVAGAEDVTYIPVIKNPKGGDSLVLYFGYDDAGLHPRAKRQIEIVANILKADPEKTILINGHADAMGSDDYNKRLSATRATEVKRGLITAGVRPAQILTRAFGESIPLSPNIQADGSDNPAGRKRNRRAEVYLNF